VAPGSVCHLNPAGAHDLLVCYSYGRLFHVCAFVCIALIVVANRWCGRMCDRAPSAHVLGAVIRILVFDFRRVNRLVRRREDSANFQLGAVGLLLPPGCLFRTKLIWSIDFAADNADNAPGHSSSGAAHMSCAHTEQAHGSTHAASFTLTLSLCCSGARS